MTQKSLLLVAAAALLAMLAPAQAADFKPSRNVEYISHSSPGSALDIFIRTVSEVIRSQKFSDANIMVNNQTDGGGAVAQRRVSQMSGAIADHTLLGFNMGDVPAILQNTSMTVDNFRVIAVLAQDNKFLYVTKSAPFKTFKGLTEALDKGERVVLGGGKADDNVMFLLLKRAIDKKGNLSYLQNGDTQQTAIAALGGHVYIAIGKPGVGVPYINSGDFFPIATEGSKRMGPPFSDVPTFRELGLDNIDFIQSRAVFGSKNMSDAAYVYWQEVFRKVAESPEFQKNYIEKYQSQPVFIAGKEAQKYFEQAQKNVYDAGIVSRKK